MATIEKTWNVANRLHSNKDSDNPQTNHIVAGADEIYDDDLDKKQSLINSETKSHLEQLDETTENTDANVLVLEDRVHAVEEHEQIMIEGGTLEVVNIPEDIKRGSGAVATGNALAYAYGTYEDSPEWVRVIVDSDEKVLFGIKRDGEVEWGAGVPTPVREYVDKKVNDILNGGSSTEKIDSLQEVFDFLEGFKNTDTLKTTLDGIQEEVEAYLFGIEMDDDGNLIAVTGEASNVEDVGMSDDGDIYADFTIN